MSTDRAMKNWLIILILFSVSATGLYSQNRIINGRVISEDFETVPGTSIVVNDSIKIAETDMDGFFRIEIPVSTKKLSFQFVGIETTNIQLQDNCDQVEIVMILSCTCDFMSPRKVDRLRKKRFKRLPELHEKAFTAGLFKTDKACYYQEFESRRKD